MWLYIILHPNSPCDNTSILLQHLLDALVLKIWPTVNGLAQGPHILAQHEHDPTQQEMGLGRPEARAVSCLGLAGSLSGEPRTAR
jgi:hypothetical protein